MQSDQSVQDFTDIGLNSGCGKWGQRRTHTYTHTQKNEDFEAQPPSRLELVARALPGRVTTMMHLASLSVDAPARAVAAYWASLSSQAHERASLDELCEIAGGVSGARFFGSVAVAGLELGMDMFRYIPGVMEQNQSVKSALAGLLMRGEPHDLIWQPAKWSRRKRELLLLWQEQACDNMARLRKECGLSQAQVSRLFVTHPRTVRRWEAHESVPPRRQQWFLWLFLDYAERCGVPSLRDRFVRESPRCGRPGRPSAHRA